MQFHLTLPFTLLLWFFRLYTVLPAQNPITITKAQDAMAPRAYDIYENMVSTRDSASKLWNYTSSKINYEKKETLKIEKKRQIKEALSYK